MSEAFCNSAFLIASSLFFWAISVSARTRASLEALSAAAWAMAISRSASAFAIEASLRILDVLSIPRSWIRPCSSVTFWILQERISIPSFSISLEAFAITWSEKESRSVLMARRVSVPMISRMLPWRESCRSAAILAEFLFKKFRIASFNIAGSSATRTFATASTMTLIKSLVGMYSSVLISTVIWPRYSLSNCSKKGSFKPARPTRTLGSFLRPEIM